MPLAKMDVIVARDRAAMKAVPAFNVDTWEAAAAVVRVAQARRAPVILQMTPRVMTDVGWAWFSRHLRALASDSDVPVALHLDHATDLDSVRAGIEWGLTSVMYDGSALPLAANIETTCLAVELGRDGGVPVEGEVGHVGRDGEPPELAYLTQAQEAQMFARATGVDLLAVAVGTRHGHAPGNGHLALDRLAEIHAICPVPLVLHGGSYVPADELRQAVLRGVVKVNVGTALRATFMSALRHAATRCETPREVVDEVGRAVEETALGYFEILESAVPSAGSAS